MRNQYACTDVSAAETTKVYPWIKSNEKKYKNSIGSACPLNVKPSCFPSRLALMLEQNQFLAVFDQEVRLCSEIKITTDYKNG